MKSDENSLPRNSLMAALPQCLGAALFDWLAGGGIAALKSAPASGHSRQNELALASGVASTPPPQSKFHKPQILLRTEDNGLRRYPPARCLLSPAYPYGKSVTSGQQGE